MSPRVTFQPNRVTFAEDPRLKSEKLRRLGRYTLLKPIGNGGMAEVWIGKMSGGRRFEKIVAVKLLPQRDMIRPDFQRSLADEAHVLMSLRHPNVVEVLDFNFEGDGPYLVMEFIEGAELRDILRHLRGSGQTMPLAAASFIVSEIANGLIHTHERSDRRSGKPLGIVHRDVSPSNILISRQGESKLTDFGIAKSIFQSDRTQVGQIKGKFRYMSPEQAKGGSLDHRSDIFSLGLVFYECLLGAPAYDDPSETKIYQMARAGKVTMPDSFDSGLKKILQHLLSLDRKERYQSLRMFLEELNAYGNGKCPPFNRDSLKAYLDGLKLAEFAEATALREEAEKWSPAALSDVPAGREKAVTLNYLSPLRKKIRMAVFAVGGLAAILLTAMVMRIPMIKTRPEASAIPKTTELPLPKRSPVSQYSAVKVPAAAPPEEKKKYAKVVFDADPFAEVSVAGFFRGIETPIQKTIAEGTHKVTFVHPPTSRRAVATLVIRDPGRTYLCRAQMEVDSVVNQPSARCWSR